MDKNQDLRRVFSRQFVCINKKKLASGNLEKEKFGKEKVKRLSVVEREMDLTGEDEFHSTTVTSGKFKLPRKIFSDTNTSVPKKLRSAIRKRSCESASGPLLDGKRSNHRANDVDLPRKDCLKKSKISKNCWSEHSSKGALSVAISKDEEEVAETLFALAGMISLNDTRVNDKSENESLNAKTSNLSTNHNSDPTPSCEGLMIPKEESEATNPTPATNGSPKDSMNDPAFFVWPKLPERKQPNLDCQVSVPPEHFQIPPQLRPCGDRQLINSSFCSSTEQNRESGFNDTEERESQLPVRESHINIGVADMAASQNEQHASSTQCRDHDLTSTALYGSGIDVLPTQSSTPNFPSWPNNISSSRPSFCEDTPSAGKAFGSVNGGRKSWRRCVAHVYISRLIQVLQASEGKDTLPSDTSQLRPLQQSSAGPVEHNRDDLNGTFAAGHMLGSAANDVHIKLKNDLVKEGGPTLSGFCDSTKQSCNFLSLSTGAGPEMDNHVNRLGITSEATGQVFQLHSAQRNTYAPNSMPQNCFPSVSYPDQIAGVSTQQPSMPPQVHLQVPPYFGNPCGVGHMGTTKSTQQPQPKQQQQIWTDQFAAQFRPGPLLPSHIASWQNSTRDPRMMHHMRAHLPSPRPSPDMIGSKFLHISQQQQQQLLRLRPALPTSNAMLQNSKLPSTCEDKGSRFHPDGVLPMQLLCNERLLS